MFDFFRVSPGSTRPPPHGMRSSGMAARTVAQGRITTSEENNPEGSRGGCNPIAPQNLRFTLENAQAQRKTGVPAVCRMWWITSSFLLCAYSDNEGHPSIKKVVWQAEKLFRGHLTKNVATMNASQRPFVWYLSCGANCIPVGFYGVDAAHYEGIPHLLTGGSCAAPIFA